MASSKISKYKRKVTLVSAVWLDDGVTVTTTAPHQLVTGDTISFTDPRSTVFYTVSIIVTGASEFTFAALERNIVVPTLFFSVFPVTFTGVTEIESLNTSNRTFQATVTTTSGNGAAVVVIQVSNDGIGWKTLNTITLASGASPVSDGFASQEAWLMSRASVTSITGTGATLRVTSAGAN